MWLSFVLSKPTETSFRRLRFSLRASEWSGRFGKWDKGSLRRSTVRATFNINWHRLLYEPEYARCHLCFERAWLSWYLSEHDLYCILAGNKSLSLSLPPAKATRHTWNCCQSLLHQTSGTDSIRYWRTNIGEVVAFIRVVEFHKMSLPYAYCIFFLSSASRVPLLHQSVIFTIVSL